jgi:hypothetical protein
MVPYPELCKRFKIMTISQRVSYQNRFNNVMFQDATDSGDCVASAGVVLQRHGAVITGTDRHEPSEYSLSILLQCTSRSGISHVNLCLDFPFTPGVLHALPISFSYVL